MITFWYWLQFFSGFCFILLCVYIISKYWHSSSFIIHSLAFSLIPVLLVFFIASGIWKSCSLIFTTDLYIICNSCGASVFSRYHFSFVRKCFGWFWGQKAFEGICLNGVENVVRRFIMKLISILNFVKYFWSCKLWCDVLSCWYWVVASFDGLV